MEIAFTKMQGLGNDFVVLDATQSAFHLTSAQIQQMANRRFGVGFDQLLVIQKPTNGEADFRLRIFNADGTEVEQCGNGARCVALYIRNNELSLKSHLGLETKGGLLQARITSDQQVMVEMGIPKFLPAEIPFDAPKADNTYLVDVNGQEIELSVVNVGNPHAVVQVDRIDSEQVQQVGEHISRHSRFPEGVNVGFMQVIDSQNIRLRVYERGSGETLACGSGACAAMVVGRRNGVLQERVQVSQPGGSLSIDWQGPTTMVKMTGPAKMVFQGVWAG